MYGCTIWTLMKHLQIKLDGNYIRALRIVLNKSWKQLLLVGRMDQNMNLKEKWVYEEKVSSYKKW